MNWLILVIFSLVTIGLFLISGTFLNQKKDDLSGIILCLGLLLFLITGFKIFPLVVEDYYKDHLESFEKHINEEQIQLETIKNLKKIQDEHSNDIGENRDESDN